MRQPRGCLCTTVLDAKLRIASLQRWRSVVDVPEHHGGVALEPPKLRALHRRVLEGAPELLLRHTEQLPRERARVLPRYRLPRRERRLFQLLTEPNVPRTHILADVATVDQLPDRLVKLRRDLALRLDREIRDAPRRIEHARLDDGRCGTGIDAPRARAAVVGLERLVGRELKLHQQRAKKEKRTELWVNEIRVLPEPAEPRASRKIALEQRSGVDVRASAHLASDLVADPTLQLAQLRVEHVVVVVAPRIARHRSRRLAATIVHRDDDRASHSIVRQPGVTPLGRPLW